MKPKVGSRVIDTKGYTASVKKLEPTKHPKLAYVLYDFQRPTSDPKCKPLSELKFISAA